MAIFVLVHGATHGGWVWRRLAQRLRANGHRVFAPSLTGAGDRAHLLSPAVGLATHVDDVANVIEFEDLRDVVLVGHSSSGPVIVTAADRLANRVDQLVHVDTIVPLNGEAAVNLLGPSRRAGFEAIARELGDGWYLPIGRGVARHGIDDPALASWIDDRLVAQPLRCLTEPVALTGAADRVPKTYVRCTRKLHGDAWIVPPWERSAGWRVVEIDAGQFVALTHASELAAILETIASER